MSSTNSPTPGLGPSIVLYLENAPPERIALFVTSAFFTSLCLIVSIYHIYTHAVQGIKERKSTIFFPMVRRKIITQILWVPITCMFSFLSLLFPRLLVFFNFVSSSYESWALFGFVALLADLVGGRYGLAHEIKKEKPTKLFAAPPFLCCLKPCMRERHLSPRMLTWCRLGVLQAAIIRPLLIALSLFLQLNDLYNPGSTSLRNSAIYIQIISVSSKLLSMYFTYTLSIALENLLKPFGMKLKFLLVKILIPIFSVQTLIISLIVNNVKYEEDVFPKLLAAVLFDNFIVSIECFLLSLLAYKAYPVHGEIDSGLYIWIPAHRVRVGTNEAHLFQAKELNDDIELQRPQQDQKKETEIEQKKETEIDQK